MIILWKLWSCSENDDHFVKMMIMSWKLLLWQQSIFWGSFGPYGGVQVHCNRSGPPEIRTPAPLSAPSARSPWDEIIANFTVWLEWFISIPRCCKILRGSQICRLPFLWTGASGQEETPPLWEVGKQTFLLFVCYLFTMRGSRLWFLSTHGGERQFFLLFASQLQKSSLERAAASKFWKICPVPSLSIILPTITEWVTTDVEIECYLVSFSALFQSFLTWFRWKNYTYLIEKHKTL